MQNLQAFLAESGRQDIYIIADYVSRHIQPTWETAFTETREKMIKLYPEIGDSVYAIYGKRLFQQVHEQFKLAGLKAKPNLPGDLMTSREWGADDRDRQRWMWSTISNGEKQKIGTIVTVVFHDHEQVRIPRAFQVLALTETHPDDVVRRLSAISVDFANAPDMNTEVAEYLANHPEEGGSGN